MDEIRVDQLAAQGDVSVDTVRYYQSKGLLPPPRREGRVAWYGPDHVERLSRIRTLQARGLSLATIGRLIDGELDRADEALATAVSAQAESAAAPGGEDFVTLAELAERSGIPLALLGAVEREGLLVPRRHHGEARYTAADVEVARAGLALLEQGMPLPDVLDLARRHHEAVRATAERAVAMFDAHVRQPLRDSNVPEDEAAARLVDAFHALLPATLTLVAHHFQRTLLDVAMEHIEAVGGVAELDAIAADADRRPLEARP